MPPRRPIGPLEGTRLSGYFDLLAWSYTRAFDRRLIGLLRDNGVRAVHSVAHDLSFARALAAAQELDAPFYLSVHDDLMYALRGRPDHERASALLASAWQAATWRFVITEALGEEYCRRYGVAPYSVVTDGVEPMAIVSRPRTGGRLRVYFMGLLHLAYEPNFLALLNALDGVGLHRDPPTATLTCRSGSLPLPSLRNRQINVLPFDSEDALPADLRKADLLYLPLPFGSEHDALVRFSLSTKLVTYLGSGVPILYHGPSFGAAHDLLAAHDAAFLVTSLNHPALAAVLHETPGRRDAVARHARALAEGEFLLDTQRRTFWSAIQNGGLLQ